MRGTGRRRQAWLGGAALLAVAVGAGWLATADELADAGAQALARALETRLPPGSELRFGGLEPTSTGGGGALFRDLRVRFGPESPTTLHLRAAEMELGGGAMAILAGRVDAMRGRDLTLEDAKGRRLAVASVEGGGLDPAAMSALLAGEVPASRPAGPLTLSGVAFDNPGSATMTANRAGWTGLDATRLDGLGVDGVAVATPGGRFTIGRIGLAALDWTRIDRPAASAALARLTEIDARGKAARKPPPPAQADADRTATNFAAMEMMLAVADGEAAGIVVEGVDFRPTAPKDASTLRMGRVALGEVSRRRMGPWTLDRLDSSGPEAQVGLADLAYDVRMDDLPIEAARAALPTLPRDAAGFARLRQILATFTGRYEATLGSLATTRPKDGAGGSFQGVSLTGESAATRSTARFDVRQMALDAARLAGQPAAGKDLDRVTGRLRSAWTIDRGARRAALDELALDLDGLGSLESAIELALPPGDDPAAGRDMLQQATAIGLARARLAYTDRSLIRRLLEAVAASGKRKTTPAQMSEALATAALDPRRTPWLDQPARQALADFIRRPGRLTIEAAPEVPATAGRLMELALGSPQAMASSLRLKVQAAPP